MRKYILFSITFLLVLIPNSITAQNLQTQEKNTYIVNGHNNIDNAITELANKLLQNNRLNGTNEEITITSFVDLHQFNKTTHFGRTISEAFFNELFTRGFNVTDFRGQETISINANGEYYLTRNIKLLNKDITSSYVLIGTYTYFEGKMVLNARILDNMSGKVVASARTNYLTNDCKLTNSCRKIRIISHNISKKKSHKSDFAIVDFNTPKQHFIKNKNPYKEKGKRKEYSRNINNVVQSNYNTVQPKSNHPLVNLIK